jgi:formylglycine-generating enzyme
MDEPEIKRKLATILVADIVGYSRLTANDEDWTIRALGEFRRIVDQIIERHDGRIFSTGGDSILAEFASPVEAVRAAVDFQEASRSRNLLQPRDRQMRFRIGINLGDVMVRGSDLLGDGVNVAARLEGLAEPGGICVSGTVWDHINGKLSIGYVDIGEQSVKNIPRPVRAYHLRVDGTVGEAIPADGTPRVGATPGRTPRAVPLMAVILGGAALVIVLLAGMLAWQLWPKADVPPVASASPGPAPAPSKPRASAPSPPAAASAPGPASAGPAPDAAATALQSKLLARLDAVVPAVKPKTREDNVRIYVTGREHKALAVSLDPPGTWQSLNRPSSDEAGETALENCQIRFGQPCALVAADGSLEPVPADGKPQPRDMPRVRYAGDFDPARIPGVLKAVRDRDDVAGYRAAPAPKAIALHPAASGLFAVTAAADQHAAEAEALKACNSDLARQSQSGSCYLYAVGDQVVLAEGLRDPKTVAVAALTAAAPAPQASANAVPDKTFRDCSECPEMVVIPAGNFRMGAALGENERLSVPATEAGRVEPQHPVAFAKPFALGKFDVTRAEFAAFVKATGFRPIKGCMDNVGGAWERREQASWEEPGFPQTARDPVVCINAIEAGAYIAWIARTTGKAYRLPSEAEWEYAARGGTTTTYYWGDDPSQACGYENVGDETFRQKRNGNQAIGCTDGFADTAPAGSFKPNPFGLYDMLGNINVLMADCWNETYAGAPTDGSAWSSGDCQRRVARKGSFGAVRPWPFRAANRFSESALVKHNRVGFRVALSLP